MFILFHLACHKIKRTEHLGNFYFVSFQLFPLQGMPQRVILLLVRLNSGVKAKSTQHDVFQEKLFIEENLFNSVCEGPLCFVSLYSAQSNRVKQALVGCFSRTDLSILRKMSAVFSVRNNVAL